MHTHELVHLKLEISVFVFLIHVLTKVHLDEVTLGGVTQPNL